MISGKEGGGETLPRDNENGTKQTLDTRRSQVPGCLSVLIRRYPFVSSAAFYTEVSLRVYPSHYFGKPLSSVFSLPFSTTHILSLSLCAFSARYCTDYVFSFAHFSYPTPAAVLRTPPGYSFFLILYFAPSEAFLSKRIVIPYREGDRVINGSHSRRCPLRPSRYSLVKPLQP